AVELNGSAAQDRDPGGRAADTDLLDAACGSRRADAQAVNRLRAAADDGTAGHGADINVLPTGADRRVEGQCATVDEFRAADDLCIAAPGAGRTLFLAPAGALGTDRKAAAGDILEGFTAGYEGADGLAAAADVNLAEAGDHGRYEEATASHR